MQDADSRADRVWKDYRWVMWMLVIVVTANSLVRILQHWRSFDHLGQFGAVVFLLMLAAFPWRLLVDLRKGRRMQTEQLVVFTYLLLMMAGNVFGR